MNDVLYTRNRIIAPIIIAVSLIGAIIFVKPLYADYIIKNAEYLQAQKTLEEKKTKLETLTNLKKSIKTSSGSVASIDKIKKLEKPWNSSDVIQAVMLNDFTKSKSNNPAAINVASISVNKWEKLPNGLSFGSVSVAIQSASIEDIIEYITYITMSSSYVFTLDNISLPIDTQPDEAVNTGGYGLTLKLWVYYFE